MIFGYFTWKLWINIHFCTDKWQRENELEFLVELIHVPVSDLTEYMHINVHVSQNLMITIITFVKRLIYFPLQWTPEVGPQRLFWELCTSASIPSSWSGSPPMSRTLSRTNQSCSRSCLVMYSLCLLCSSSLPFVVKKYWKCYEFYCVFLVISWEYWVTTFFVTLSFIN